MSDVRLVATNPDDGTLVPVASNSSGQLAVQSPSIEKVPNDLDVEGDLDVKGDLDVSNLRVSGTATIGLSQNISLNGEFGTASFVDGSVSFNSDASIGRLQIRRTNAGKAFVVNNNTADTVSILGDGSASFASTIRMENPGVAQIDLFDTGEIKTYRGTNTAADLLFSLKSNVGGTAATKAKVTADGSASFEGDVIVGSRNKNWMLVEQGGLCHMVEQTRSADLIDEGFSVNAYPKLRDVFNELDLIEQALNTVMEKLRLTPPAGWEVWDGSDNI